MGLDMCLYVKKYESCCSWSGDYEKKKVGFYPEELKEIGEQIDKNNFMSKETLYQVAYWRKSNMIHRYFIERCADGQDDCSPVYVQLKDIKDLVQLCRDVIAHPEDGPEKLPTTGGFFFGSTDYEDWYLRDLEYTVEILKPVISFMEERKEKGEDWSLEYHASW